MSSPPGVRILTTRTCRWTLRLSVALREKSVPFELVNVLQDGRKAPWFAASTPFGKTPVLEHGGRTLPESLIICEYIDETFGGRALLPRDPLERAWARVWMRFCDYTLIKGLSDIARATEVVQRTQAVAALIDEGRRLETYRVASVTGGPVSTGGVNAIGGAAGAANAGAGVGVGAGAGASASVAAGVGAGAGASASVGAGASARVAAGVGVGVGVGVGATATASAGASAGGGAGGDTGTGVARYWHGDELTLPDICFYTFFDALELTGSAVRDAFLDACPSLARWRDALVANGVFSTAGQELDALGV